MEKASSPKNQRSCVTCGKKVLKKDLLRMVKTSQDGAKFDESGKLPGRGAYVCSLNCLEEASKTKRLERALKMTLTEEDYQKIALDILTHRGYRKEDEE